MTALTDITDKREHMSICDAHWERPASSSFNGLRAIKILYDNYFRNLLLLNSYNYIFRHNILQ